MSADWVKALAVLQRAVYAAIMTFLKKLFKLPIEEAGDEMAIPTMWRAFIFVQSVYDYFFSDGCDKR